MCLSVVLYLTMVLTHDFLNSTHWATMAHLVLDEYNSLPNAYKTNLCKQSATKLLKLLNKYLLMVTFENGKNYSIRFENSHNGLIFDLK